MPKKKSSKILAGKQWLPDPMYDALNQVIKLCGLQGESGTEEFYYMLRDILEDLDGTTIVEHRGTKADGSIGCQTVLPLSLHRASGEA